MHSGGWMDTELRPIQTDASQKTTTRTQVAVEEEVTWEDAMAATPDFDAVELPPALGSENTPPPAPPPQFRAPPHAHDAQRAHQATQQQYNPQPYVAHAAHHMSYAPPYASPPPPPIPLTQTFMNEWKSLRSFDRVVRVTYMGQAGNYAYDDRHKLWLPAGTVLGLEELQNHAVMMGWPRMPIRLWFEMVGEGASEGKYITSTICRPPELSHENPQMQLIREELEALKQETEAKDKTWFDQVVDFVLAQAPLLRVWFTNNWVKIKEGVKAFIEWVAACFKPPVAVAAPTSPPILEERHVES